MRRLKRYFLWNRYILISLALLSIQQIFVGHIVYSLSDWTYEFDLVKNKAMPLKILRALIFSYLFGGFSRTALQMGIANAWKNYCQQILLMASGNLQWSSLKNRDIITARLGTEAHQTLTEFLTGLWDIISLILNLAFTLFPMIYFFGKPLLIALSLPLIFSTFFLKFFNLRLKRLTELTQQQKQKIMLKLPFQWDNQIIADEKKKENSFFEFQGAMQDYQSLIKKRSFLEESISICPIILGLLVFRVQLSWEQIFSASYFLSLSVIFPRVVQWLQNCNSFTGALLFFFIQRTKMKRLLEVFDALISSEPKDRIISHQIFIYSHQLKRHIPLEELFTHLTNFSKGRITLRGKNGSGKSSLLEWIKQIKSESRLVCLRTDSLHHAPLSSGEIAKQKILEILSDPPQMVLFDEWDASLDMAHIQECNALLEELSQKIWVIEVRHRQ